VALSNLSQKNPANFPAAFVEQPAAIARSSHVLAAVFLNLHGALQGSSLTVSL
jgi:hypothetical protein